MANSESWRKRLNLRLGDGIMAAALEDFRQGRDVGRVWSAAGAKALALPIYLLPLAVAVAGVWLIVAFWPGVAGFFYGGVLLLAAWWLRPRRARLPDNLKRRDDLPRTFAMLDAVCSRMGAPQFDALRPGHEFDASVSEARGQRVLGHARLILDRWSFLTRPGREDHLVTWMIFALPSLMVELWTEALERLTFLESQRAEYLADAKAARLAGVGALIGLLEKVSLGDLVRNATRFGQAEHAASGTALIERIAGQVRVPDPALRVAELGKMEAEDWTVDTTHPPTRHRIGFLKRLDMAERDRADLLALVAETETELRPLVEPWGQKLQDRLVRQ